MTAAPESHFVARVSEQLRMRKRSLYLGASDAGPVFGGWEDHLLLMGPPRCGKTSGLLIPSVAAHPGPVVALSTRSDIIGATLAPRVAIAEGAPVSELVLAQSSGLVAPQRWSITDGCEDWNLALDRAQVLVRTAFLEDKGDSTFWRESAIRLIAGCLHASSVAGQDEYDIAHFVESGDLSGYREVLAEAYGGASHPSILALDAIFDDRVMPAETRAGLFATAASQVLGAFRYSPANAGSDISLDEFVRGDGALYAIVPDDRQAVLRPLVTAFVSAVVAAWKRSPRRDDATLLLALDEASNISPLPGLDTLLTTGGGDGVQAIVALQHPRQATEGWLQKDETILGTPTWKALFAGVDAPDYLDRFSVFVGDTDVHDPHVTLTRQPQPGKGLATGADLVRERKRLEQAVSGLHSVAARKASLEVAMELAEKRRRSGIRGRHRTGRVVDDLLREVYEHTDVEMAPSRRRAIPVSELHAGRQGHFFCWGESFQGFRRFAPYFRDPFWASALGTLR